jgi:hypothetical protein
LDITSMSARWLKQQRFDDDACATARANRKNGVRRSVDLALENNPRARRSPSFEVMQANRRST